MVSESSERAIGGGSVRVLLVHNYYGSSAPSGENQVFEAERAMLQRHGVTVDVFTRHSDEIRGTKAKVEGEGEQWTCRFLSKVRKLHGLIKGAVCTVANPFAARALGRKIQEFKPDVVHFHNTFPLISPLAIRAAIKQAPVVMHNYRTVCAAGVPMRGNRVCDACFSLVKVIGEGERRGLTVIPALRNRCYRGSFLATLPLALNIWLYRKSWAKWVSRFICLTPFAKEMMTSAGFPQEQVVVKGNFVGNFAGKTRMAGFAEKQGYIFVGRLSDEKGVKTLLDAWRLVVDAVKMKGNRSLGRLLIIGDGDQRAEYEKLASGDFILNEKDLFVCPAGWYDATFRLCPEGIAYQ